MYNLRFMILLVSNIMIVLCTYSQKPFSYFFHHLDQSNGLLHNEVLSITQDGKGFIWVTTPNGLQRYDGLSFKSYPQILKNVEDGSIYRAEIFSDKKNDLLWLQSHHIIEKMSLKKNYSTLYNDESLLKDSSLKFVEYRNEKNIKWILNKHGLFNYDNVTKKYILLQLNIIPPNVAQTSYFARDSIYNQTWVNLWTELYVFDNKTRKIFSHNNNPTKHPLLELLYNKKRAGSLRFVMIDSRNDIWVTTWGDTLYRYDNDQKKISIYELSGFNKKNAAPSSPVIVNAMYEDNHQSIWVATENGGLLRYNNQADNFDYCLVKESTKESIQYNYKIYSVYQDKEENIWLGTDKGISIFNPYQQYFKTVRHEENNTLSITKNEITSFIQATNGDIFIGTWGGGLGVYSQALNFKKNIFFKLPSENNFVWSFIQPNKETLWIGCQIGYLISYNLKTGSYKTLSPPEMEANTIRCMEKDKDENIWLGLQNGQMVKWDKKENKFFKCPNLTADSIHNKTPIINIFIDKLQQCWVSTSYGLKQFDLKKKTFTNTWIPDKNIVGSIASKSCEGIEELNDSTLIVATIFGGLNYFNKRTKIFYKHYDENSLAFRNIHAVKKDTNGFLWFTTDYNLYKLNLHTKKTVAYNIQNGLINSSFVSPKFYQLNDGQWVTFTLTEALIFNPNRQFFNNGTNSKIEITGFNIFNKPLFIDSLLAENKPVTLTHKQNFFTIEYASLHFSSLGQTNYYHRLIDVDKDWVNGGNKRSANYTDLQPGNYTFQIKAATDDANEQITSFEIIITPPFYKTWWFIAIAISAFAIILYAFIKWRIKSVKTIASEKLKVQKLEAETYKNKLELEQITNYFSNSLNGKKTVEDALWDVAKNLIGRMGFVDCIIYLWNSDKTKMVQKAGIGPKGSIEQLQKKLFDVLPGQGVVGHVILHKEVVTISDTSLDARYRMDEVAGLSEISVPILFNNELLGVIDSEHPQKKFYTSQHIQLLTTIAALIANKIKSIEAEQTLLQTQIEIYSINEQLSNAKLDALRSQMNPHFIFNCINSIDALIQSNDKYHATVYLNKFAKLLRNILDSSKQNTVTLSKDIDTLKLYVELEQLRHENKFTAEIYTDDFLIQDDFKVPPLIIQPFVENAILHGIRYRTDNNGKLKVSVSKKNNYLQYVIEDNGVGISFHQNKKNEKTSYGIEMTIDRVKLFNNEEKASIEIIDLIAQHKPIGTRVTVLLKLT